MTMMKNNCEWCHIHYSGAATCTTLDQEFINWMFSVYNKVDPGKANPKKTFIWQQWNRYNEWPKVGDKRGRFCSETCRLDAHDLEFHGSWHSRGWFW